MATIQTLYWKKKAILIPRHTIVYTLLYFNESAVLASVSSSFSLLYMISDYSHLPFPAFPFLSLLSFSRFPLRSPLSPKALYTLALEKSSFCFLEQNRYQGSNCHKKICICVVKVCQHMTRILEQLNKHAPAIILLVFVENLERIICIGKKLPTTSMLGRCRGPT